MESPPHNPSTPPNPNSNLHRAYGRTPANSVAIGLAARHKLHSAATADFCFHLGHYDDCAGMCEAILASNPLPAEAIQARCHMYLAMEGVGSTLAPTRLLHAWKAVELWGTVIDRSGTSRFPVEKATEQRQEAQLLVEAVEVSIDEEDEDVPMNNNREREDEGLEDGELVDSGLEDGQLKERNPRRSLSKAMSFKA